MTIDKSANGTDLATVGPGDDITFSIQVVCADAPCENAAITDSIPVEFVDFPIVGISIDPAGLEYTLDTGGCDTVVTDPCDVSLTFTNDLGDGLTGLPVGSGTLTFTLEVPEDLDPAWEFNGDTITNEAFIAWTNPPDGVTPPISDDTSVIVNVDAETAIDVNKTWSPAAQQFDPGAESTITFDVANTSNIPAEQLVIQEPATAVDGATELDPSNPFRVVDFTGFGTSTLPPDATTVRVDAYVYDEVSGTWSWTVIPFVGASPQLPPGVTDPSDVGGLRLTYSSDIQPGSTVSVPIQVEQRATERDTDETLAAGAHIDNVIAGELTFDGEPPVDDTGTAPFDITELTVAVDASKSFSPAIVPAGTPSTATITATNTSNGPVDTITISDTNFFDDDMLFGGFPGGIAWPATTDSATITWEIGGVPQPPVAFASGADPPPPAGTVTGFTVTFTGTYPPTTSATIPVTVTPSTDLVTAGSPPVTRTNTVTAEDTNAAGSGTDSAPADLTTAFPEVHLNLDKSIVPSAPVTPGGGVLASITAEVGSGSADVAPTSIVIDDTWAPDYAEDDFWNAFDLYAIAPTQVPANTTMTIEYQVAPDETWQTLTVAGPQSDAFTFSMDHDELVAALAPTASDEVTGLRFTYENPDGLPQGTTVQPNVTFTARSELRTGGPTDTPDDGDATSYTNTAIGQAEAIVDGIDDPIESLPDDGTDDAAIVIDDGSSGDGPSISKRWVQPADHTADLTTLVSQSGALASTRLGWLVPTPGFDSVVISDTALDPSSPLSPAQTTFQAFDLISIDRITFAQDNRLQWDTVSQVELFLGDGPSGSWVTVTPPGGGWMDAGGFVGYTLSAAESAAATGVRLTVVPNDIARTGAVDPTAPPAGSGVASSAVGAYRPIDLTWQLRNTVRALAIAPANPYDPWVISLHGYNDLADDAIIRNSARATASAPTGDVDATADDYVILIDELPAVAVEKSVSPTQLTIPSAADVDPSGFPQAVFTVVGSNASPARASYVRVTDPVPCPPGALDDCVMDADDWDGDPFAGRSYDPTINPYENFDILSLGFAATLPDEIDTGASTVTLWHRAADGSLSTTLSSIDAATALGEADLADVVGVSVVWQDTSPETDGGSITQGNDLTLTVTARLRVDARSTGATITAETVRNIAQSQSYDPVIAPDTEAAGSTPYADAEATIELLAGDLDVIAGKTLTPDTILEADASTTPVRVGLTADSGASTAPTQRVTITDDDPAFWNGVQLADPANLTATLPAGADEMRVDLLVGGTWILGTFGPTPELPTADATQVIGVRVVFQRADGAVFSTTAPPAPWSTAVGFDVTLLTTQRDGTPLPFPGTLNDTADALSERTDDLFADASDDAAADLALDPGTHAIDVVKTQPGTTHTVTPGSSQPWLIAFTNTGTGYLTIEQVTDLLPEYLQWDGVDPDYTTDGDLGTDVTLSSNATGRLLTFTWPDGENRMAPGETFTITIGLILLPGLGVGDTTTNTFVVNTDSALDGCTNTSGNGQGTVPLPADQCGTTNFVGPTPGGALFAQKGVRGEIDGDLVDGQQRPGDPSATCPVDSEGFTRLPCAAYSVVGATDEWRIQVINAGTVGYDSITLVDPLPRPGDRMLATGSARNSLYEPVLELGSLITDLPGGATGALEVTTTADACVGPAAGSVWLTDPTCATTATWVPLGSFAGDPVQLTAVRATITFPTPLPAGGSIELRYRTVNQPATAALPNLAPIDVPDTEPGLAWNQVGVTALLTDATTRSVAPVQAGVMLLAGDLGVQKVVAGATSLAPDAFDFQVECTIAGVALGLPDGGELTVTTAANLSGEILAIPLGAECTVTETGVLGTFGEAARDGDAATVQITTLSGDEVPATQVVTVTNTYLPVPPPDPIAPTGIDSDAARLAVALAMLLLAAGVWLVVIRRPSRRPEVLRGASGPGHARQR